MSVNYAKHVSTKSTPQTEAVPGKNQVENNAGGFVFQVDDWNRLRRFLVLGAEGGTYYVAEKALTKENATVVNRCLSADPKKTVQIIAEVSERGRAPKNDAAVFSLALAASHANPEARKEAYAAINKVCRIGTHIFQFVAACDAMRGWGAGLRNAVASWYVEKTPEQLGYQLTKYQQRDGWSHRDVMRKCHVQFGDPARQAIARWAVNSGGTYMDERSVIRGKGEKAKSRTYSSIDPVWLGESIHVLEALKKAESVDEVVKLIENSGDKAPRELVPTKFLGDARVWGALLPNMPMTAMVRSLGTMTRNGLIVPMSSASKIICDNLRNAERIKKARVHPLSLLVAMKIYQQGHGEKSTGDGWKPDQGIVDAMNDAVYLAFDAVESTGKRWFYGLDVSGSMSAPICGSPLSCCEASTMLALVSSRTEPYTFIGRFNSQFNPVNFGKHTRLDDALRETRNQNFGSTDCSLLPVYALADRIEADVFVILTDNETYAGREHPFQTLKKYRDKTGINAKMIVVGMTSAGFTIADPSDSGMLDICGMSTDVPSVMAGFVSQEF